MSYDTRRLLRGQEQEASDDPPWPVVVLAGAATIAALLFGMYRVVELGWVADDAFISFRYAENLAAGHGLVFNVGERVEGYTNFLWTLLVACGMKLHLDPVHLTQIVGGLSFMVTASVLAFLGLRLRGEGGLIRPQLFLPVGALAFLIHYDSQVWATGGLETALVTALVVAGFARLVLATGSGAHLTAGFLFTAAALTRPDALIFGLASLSYLTINGRTGKRDLLAFALPFVLVFVPYWLARYAYYGFFYPNSYYAKSGGLAYYRQGLAYLGLYVRANYVFLLVPIAAVQLIWQRRLRLVRYPEELSDRIAGLAMLLLFAHTFYIVRVGGDFMFARFLIPVTPLAFLLLESWLFKWVISWRQWCVAGLVLVTMVAARFDPFDAPRHRIYGIAQERSWYPEIWRQDSEEYGRTLRRCLKGTNVRLAFAGTYAATTYYAALPYALEFETGLTDTAIAHRSILTRGRPGHEKRASVQDLLQRNIHFLLHTPPRNPTVLDDVATIQFGHRAALIVTYDPALMEHLKQFHDVSFVDFPAYLDAHTAEILDLPDSTFAQVYHLFRNYYFDHHFDSVRAKPFEDRGALIQAGG